MSTTKINLNMMLSTGAMITCVKFRKNNPIATLFITDFVNSARVLFDFNAKKFLTNDWMEKGEVPAKEQESIAGEIIRAIAAAKDKPKKKRVKEEKPKQVKKASKAKIAVTEIVKEAPAF